MPQPASKEALLAWPGFTFEPLPVLRQIRVPTLAIYGARDINVRAVDGAATMRSIFGVRGTVRLFDGADHELKRVGPDDDDDFGWLTSPGYASGYFQATTSWLAAQAKR